MTEHDIPTSARAVRVDFGTSSAQSSDPAVVNIADSLRAALAGGEAAKLLASSAALFEAGGKHVLSEGAKRAVREVAERGASRAIQMTTGPILESAGSLAAKPILALSSKVGSASATTTLAKGVGAQAMRMAGKQVLKGAGKAAGIGFVLDGAFAAFEAVIAVRNGSSDKKTAALHVAKEATTGAIATGAGVLLGAGLVALTGGIAAPVVFAVGALGSIGTKRLLRRVVR
ncbi:MAG: hypothetical protein JWP87_5989 [Labilithrix sp.]|nr:hypothetical protein [Labilithrix sp.]